jgi:hypothetical protein
MNDFYKDLLKAQTQIEDVQKDATNPFFKSGYATLNATIEACKKILNDNNFIVLQPIQSDSDGVYVCTTLIHISGEKIESRMKIESKASNDPQAQGSAISYARRYSLQSFLLMSAVDDDGEKATNHDEPAKSQTFGTGKYKCEICGTNDKTAHKPACPNANK